MLSIIYSKVVNVFQISSLSYLMTQIQSSVSVTLTLEL